MSYYDIDEILAESSAGMTCHFPFVAKDLAYFDVTLYQQGETDLPAGHGVHLPLWLARSLIEKRLVKVILPAPWDAHSLKYIHVAPHIIPEFGDKYPYFYEVGCTMATITGDFDMHRQILDIFKQRLHQLIALRIRRLPDAYINELESLQPAPYFTSLERYLHQLKRSVERDTSDWRMGRLSQ